MSELAEKCETWTWPQDIGHGLTKPTKPELQVLQAKARSSKSRSRLIAAQHYFTVATLTTEENEAKTTNANQLYAPMGFE